MCASVCVCVCECVCVCVCARECVCVYGWVRFGRLNTVCIAHVTRVNRTQNTEKKKIIWVGKYLPLKDDHIYQQ